MTSTFNGYRNNSLPTNDAATTPTRQQTPVSKPPSATPSGDSSESVVSRLESALAQWASTFFPAHRLETVPFLQSLLASHQLTALGDGVVRWSPMKVAHADQILSRAVFMACELAKQLLRLIAEPSAFRFVGKIFSNGSAPSEPALIQQPAAAFEIGAGGASQCAARVLRCSNVEGRRLGPEAPRFRY